MLSLDEDCVGVQKAYTKAGEEEAWHLFIRAPSYLCKAFDLSSNGLSFIDVMDADVLYEANGELCHRQSDESMELRRW